MNNNESFTDCVGYLVARKVKGKISTGGMFRRFLGSVAQYLNSTTTTARKPITVGMIIQPLVIIHSVECNGTVGQSVVSV